MDKTLLIFIFCATVTTYALHRLISLQKTKPFQEKGRFRIILNTRRSILIYALIGAIGAAITLFYLPFRIQLTLVLPILLSLGYVLPFLKNGKRLRDVHGIKIFLIAIVWAYVGVVLPAVALERYDAAVWWILSERALFIFSITLAFDIRDLAIDQHTDVETLPSYLGEERTKKLAWATLCAMIVVVSCNPVYDLRIWATLLFSAILSGYLVQNANAQRHDYYYTAVLDGMILLQAALVCGLFLID